VRLLSLLIMDSLVMRSKDFRTLVVASLPSLLPLLLGYQAGNPLPQDKAERLKETALECLKRWELAFGAHPHYVNLILAKRYVEHSLRLLLPDLRERASRQERERRERKERTQALLSARVREPAPGVPAGCSRHPIGSDSSGALPGARGEPGRRRWSRGVIPGSHSRNGERPSGGHAPDALIGEGDPPHLQLHDALRSQAGRQQR